MNNKYHYKNKYISGLIFTFVFFFFFRAQNAFNIPASPDASCYLSWLYKFLGRNYSGICYGDFFPGIALLWLPLTIIFSALSFFTPLSHYTMVSLSISVSALLFWGFTLLLASKICQEMEISFFEVILWLFSVPILYYSTSRVDMAHSGELLLSTLMLFFILKNQTVKAFIAFFLLFLTRLNDFTAILLPLTLIIATRKKILTIKSISFYIFFLVVIISIIIFSYFAFLTDYNRVNFYTIFSRISFDRLLIVLFGTDWGLIWTAPWWLFVLIIGLLNFLKISNLSRCSLLWMLTELFCCIGWNSNGGDFAYRYLIGTYAGTLLIWRDIRKLYVTQVRIGKFLLLINALWITFLTWIYRTYPLFSPDWISVRNPHYLPHFQLKALSWFLEPTRLIEPIRLSPIPVTICSWFQKNWCQDLYSIDVPILNFDKTIALTFLVIIMLFIGILSFYHLLKNYNFPKTFYFIGTVVLLTFSSKTFGYIEDTTYFDTLTLLVKILKIFFIFFIPFLILIFGIHKKLDSLIKKNAINWHLSIIICYLVYSFIWYLLHLPIDYFGNFFVQKILGLSNKNTFEWSINSIKFFLLCLVLSFPSIYILYTTLLYAKKRWWLYFSFYSSLALFLFVFVFSYAYLFNRYPLRPLQQLDIDLAKSIPYKDIFILEDNSNKLAKAQIIALFNKPYFIVTKSLLESLDNKEFLFAIGHEIGHWEKAHLVKLIIAVSVLILISLFCVKFLLSRKTFFSFNIKNIQSPTSMPLLFILVAFFIIILSPFLVYYSRQLEFEADSFSAKVYANKNVAISALIKLKEKNKINDKPPFLIEFLFHTHPSIERRIENLK